MKEALDMVKALLDDLVYYYHEIYTRILEFVDLFKK